MSNRDFRDTDRRDRSGLFDGSDIPFDRGGGVPSGGGFPPVRRPYPDRSMGGEAYPRYGVRDDVPPVSVDYPGNGNVNIYSPKSYSDVQTMIDILRRNESIIVNLEGIESSSAQRILDFLSGAAYAMGGSMRRLKENSTFLITPQGMGITDTNDDRLN